jgi:hypothetical protein
MVSIAIVGLMRHAYFGIDRPVVCIGTDFESQKRYDAFMSARGISPHVDWLNLSTEELMTVDFPLYAYDQRVGDLVVFPPATAHQVWNPATLSTKLVWNILHPLSLEVGFQYVQPPFNRLCHPDVARTNLSLACAMLSLIQENNAGVLPPDLPLLSRLFRQMVHEESIEGLPATPINLIEISNAVIATCNFCNTAIWNRHVRCTECADFDLCLACYLNGRSCEHSQSYAWAELVPTDQCTRILNRAREILGFQPEEPSLPDRCKTLGTAVNDLMKAKQHATSRLCHLCRIEHSDWKGRRCDKCTAFFCYRGLYRHFDVNSADVIRHSGLWTCPKCLETCNCRCCHFSTAYRKAEKPASKRRVKPFDSRGKIMGFTDNVYDQKRGQRNSSTTNGLGGSLPGLPAIAGRKRQISSSDIGPATPLRKLELPTPEPDFANRIDLRRARDGSEYSLDPQFDVAHLNGGSHLHMLPSIKTLPEPQLFTPGSIDEHLLIGSTPGSMTTLATAALTQGRLNQNAAYSHTLAPILNHNPGPPRQNGHMPTLYSPTKELHVQSGIDKSIAELESRIATLRAYEAEFIQLDLDDSKRLLADQIAGHETELRVLKKEKSLQLAERLLKEGFGGLADGVRKEIERWGKKADGTG